MSRVKVSLRIRGDLEHMADLTKALEGMPTKFSRRGSQTPGGMVQPMDVLRLQLAQWHSVGVQTDDGRLQNGHELGQDSGEKDHLMAATATLRRLAPVLASLDRSRCQAELYVSTIREEAQGGFELPAELLSVAAVAGLSLATSILVMLDDDLHNETGDV